MSEARSPESEQRWPNTPSGWKGPYALRALRHRNFFLLWTGQLISLTGTWMQGLSLPWLTYHLAESQHISHPKLILGVVAAASMLPSLLITLPSGVIADRFSKRRVVIGTQTLLMFQALILAALVFTHTIQVWHIIVLAAFAGAANAMDMPTRQAMVGELVGKEDLVNAVALNSSIFNFTRIAGPSVAGIVVAEVGPGWCFLINGISYIAAIIGLFMMRNVKPAKRSDDREPMLRQIGEGLAHVWKNSLTRNMMIMTAISTLFIAQYASFMPVFAKNIFNVDEKGLGYMVSSIGLGALLAAGAVAALGHRVKQTTIVYFGAFLSPAALIGLALSPNFYCALASLVVVGFGMMMFWAVSNSIMQIAAPPGLVGRVMSVRALVLFGLGAPGAAMMGAFAEMKHIGIQGSVMIGALIVLASSLYFVLSTRSAYAQIEPSAAKLLCSESPASLTPDEANASIE